MKGKFVVVDGLDGVGKGLFLDTFVANAKAEGAKVFDVHEYWERKNNDVKKTISSISDAVNTLIDIGNKYPEFKNKTDVIGQDVINKYESVILALRSLVSSVDFYYPVRSVMKNYDIIYTSEPTFSLTGLLIRNEFTAKNNRCYSPHFVAEAYALDRRMLYEQLLLPALDSGIDVYQSRSISTTIVYQRQSALDKGEDYSIEDILSIPNNAFCYEHPMDFLVIPTIKDVNEVMRRLNKRCKDDNCEFENLEFQLKLKKIYDSKEFQDVFLNKGVQIEYLDAANSVEDSQKEAEIFYSQYLKRKK